MVVMMKIHQDMIMHLVEARQPASVAALTAEYVAKEVLKMMREQQSLR